jgi:hypothetical protein
VTFLAVQTALEWQLLYDAWNGDTEAVRRLDT